MSNIPRRNLASVCHLLKKLTNLRGGQLDVTTNINFKSCTYHPPAPSSMGIWAIWNSLKIHCYTCMLFETCWSRLIYTKLSSHRSVVINTLSRWRDAVFLHEVSIGRPKEDEKWTFWSWQRICSWQMTGVRITSSVGSFGSRIGVLLEKFFASFFAEYW